MVITLGSELEAALKEAAGRQGVAPEVLALDALQESLRGHGLGTAAARRMGAAVIRSGD